MSSANGSKVSVNPSEAKPSGAAPASPNANGVVFGVYTAGTRGTNPGAK